MKHTWLQCPKCGGEAGVRGPDAIDYCEDCGIVEGECKVIEVTDTLRTVIKKEKKNG